MTFRTPRSPRRRVGATTVETAMVLLPLFMFLFGVFEFGRLLMSWSALNNAARIGCRWALVNNTDATIASDITTQVTNCMGNLNTTAFTSFTVTVSGTHAGVTYTGAGVNNLVAGDMITVTVTGTYKFLNIIPGLNMSTVSITSAPTMVCEGGT